ncbi:MAG: ATP-dependent helicase [Lachnospiraceae bacterium]|jgi:superfamily II DNA or RNA helicase|nr:ATP-dependent helicase [Lachnospiraceae bacterium]
MAYSGETIRLKSRSPQEYEKGEALFERGKVQLVSNESFWKGEEKIRALVEDEEKSWRVSLLIKSGYLYQASCQCQVHREYKGLCRHEAAAALYVMEAERKGHAPCVSTPLAVRRMLQSYTGRDMREAVVSGMDAKIRLEPSFRFSEGKLLLSLKVGTGRMYQVKDLTSFVMALEDESYVEYGKQLAFYHSMSAFEPASARLAEEVARLVGDYLSVYQRFMTYRSSPRPTIREFELSPGACDSMMKVLAGWTVEISGAGEEVKQVQIKKENPCLMGTIRTLGRDGFRLSLLDHVQAFYGKRKLYLFRKDVLYCCDRACSSILKEFVRSMEEGERGLSAEIAGKDLPVFCDYVLPKISKYVTMEPLGVDLEQYHADPLAVKFYFDSPSSSEVTLRAEFWYGEKKYTPFSPAGRAETFRDQAGELMAGTLIRKYFTGRYAGEDCFAIRDDEEALFRFLERGLSEFETRGQVYLSQSMKERRILSGKKLAFGVSLESGWLDLTVDTGDIPAEEIGRILSAYQMKKQFYQMKSGDFLCLEDSGFEILSELSRGLALGNEQSFQGPIHLPGYRSLFVDKVLGDGNHMEVRRDQAFRSVVQAMSSWEEGDFSVPDSLREVLRDYQKKGFFWLKTLDALNFGGILADDMGLGKTIQVIALLLSEAEKNPDMTALIVCPASLIYNWESEIIRFGKGLSAMVVAGSGADRKEMLWEGRAQVMITSYELLRRDIDLYEKKEFRFQILDEAQYIKNYTTKNAETVKQVRARTRFALTGTPIENRLSDLWSIFDFLMPGFLYGYTRFKKEFELPIAKGGGKKELKRLNRLIAPFLLRRSKKDVLTELPDKLEHTVYSKLEGKQRELYNAHALVLKQKLQDSGEEEYRREQMQILAELLQLRQICCDPSLCYEGYEDGSAKLATCMELVTNAVSGGHKILLFSQFTSMLEILEKQLQAEQIAYYKLTGKTGKEDRLALVNAFNQDEIPVFLISLKAGGTGLNLTAADMVIHYDPWWNLAAENQATDRAHRIGQKKVVSVFRLIARDTIEEGVLKLQARKRELSEQVTSRASALTSMGRTELIRLLEEEHEVY